MLDESREVIAAAVKCLTLAVAGARTSNTEFAEEGRRLESCTNNLAAERAGSRHLEEDMVDAVVEYGCDDDGQLCCSAYRSYGEMRHNLHLAGQSRADKIAA